MSVLPDRTAMSFEAWWTPVRVALIVWFIVHVVIFVSQWPAIAALRLADTDDAMRMAQVRDLLAGQGWWDLRSEEHTSELQSLMRISYAVFCLKNKKQAHKQVHKDNNADT